MKVLEELNQLCSKQTMRYYWPTIIAICSEHDSTKAYASELQELKTPANPKPLPRGLLLACKTTSETIATAKLIPVDAEVPEDGEVTLEVAAGRSFQEPDLGTFHGAIKPARVRHSGRLNSHPQERTRDAPDMGGSESRQQDHNKCGRSSDLKSDKDWAHGRPRRSDKSRPRQNQIIGDRTRAAKVPAVPRRHGPWKSLSMQLFK
jgi:hypothetical protein